MDRHVYHARLSFHNIKTEIDKLDDLLFNTRGIRDDILMALQLSLRNIKAAASNEDIFKTMDACDELTIQLQINLHIKYEPQPDIIRDLAYLRSRGLDV